MDNNENSESKKLLGGGFRLTGIHRGMKEPPSMKNVQEASLGYCESYSQYKEADRMREQLYFMVSMGFPENVIRMLSEISVRIWDLDFLRILYFITNDLEYVKRITAKTGRYIFEDVLDDALEVAIESRHPEYREIKEKEEHLGQLKVLADLRIAFMEENNKCLTREIEKRKEEKTLYAKASELELEKLQKENERLNQIIGELKNSLSEKETDIQRLNEELEKACSERDENKAANDTFANGIQNILDALHTAKTEIKGGIESVRQDVHPAKKQDSKYDETTNASDSNDEDVKQISKALNSLEKKIEQMSNSMRPETAEGAMAQMIGRMDFLAEKTMKSVFAVDQNVIDMINAMQTNLLENIRAGFEMSGKKKRFGRPLESASQKTDTEKPVELIRLEPIRYRPEPPDRSEELVKRILSDPQLTPEHYKLILYCVDQGLPYRYLQEITNLKMDPDRLEELVIFYFKLNKMKFQYRKKEDTCDIESVQTPAKKKEPMDSESKVNNVADQDLKRGQKHKSQATSMVFAAASDEEEDKA